MDEENKFVGGPAIVVWHRAVADAARVVGRLPPDQLAGLKVRSGEHLAAILVTAFLGTAPSSIDTDGDVDLRFKPRAGFSLFPTSPEQIAFEIKSMPGPFRRFDHSISTAETPDDVFGSSFEVKVERADNILTDAQPLIDEARRGLVRKTSGEVSRNIFLIIHPFDRLAAETIQSPIIGAALGALELEPDIDTVWVLWVPDHLTVWSNTERVWTDLFFCAASEEEVASKPPGALTVLQDAESEFLSAIGYRAGSPYLFGLTSQ